jgi:hypothetical protein
MLLGLLGLSLKTASSMSLAQVDYDNLWLVGLKMSFARKRPQKRVLRSFAVVLVPEAEIP